MMASVSEVPSAGGALQGTPGQEVVGIDPRLGDDAESSLRDLVVCGTGAGVFGSFTSGDVAQPLGPREPGAQGCLGCVC
jgi:hypothetical protein